MEYYNNGKPIPWLEYNQLREDNKIDEDIIYLVEDKETPTKETLE